MTRDWLTKSIEQGAKADETPFLVPRKTKPSVNPRGAINDNLAVIRIGRNMPIAGLVGSIPDDNAADDTYVTIKKHSRSESTLDGSIGLTDGAADGLAPKTDDDNAADDTNVTIKKRSRSESTLDGKAGLTDGVADGPAQKKLKIKDGQQAESASLHVPVDEAFPNSGVSKQT